MNKTNIGKRILYKDHLVSGEVFEIVEHEMGILKTIPVPEKLSKYYESDDYISHNDSRNSLQDKVYHFVKSFMISQKSKWINSYFEKGSILDFGAGTGEFLNKMKKNSWKVEGVEPNSTARNLANSKNLSLKSELSEIADKKFEVISLWHVLEHLPDFENKIQEFHQLLTQDGLLVIAVPNFNSYDAKYYKEDWAAWDVPRHLWHFSRNGLELKVENYGFKLIEQKPLIFDSFYVSLLSEKNKTSGGNILSACYRGLVSNIKASATKEYSSVVYFFKKTVNT